MKQIYIGKDEYYLSFCSEKSTAYPEDNINVTEEVYEKLMKLQEDFNKASEALQDELAKYS